MKNYNPAEVSVIIAGSLIQGFADGSFIKAERDEPAYSLYMGTDGEGTRAKSNNKSGTITLTLTQSSSSNDILSALAQADELSDGGVFSVLIKDNSGSSLCEATKSYIEKMPAVEFGREVGSREWVIKTDNLIIFAGGNQEAEIAA